MSNCRNIKEKSFAERIAEENPKVLNDLFGPPMPKFAPPITHEKMYWTLRVFKWVFAVRISRPMFTFRVFRLEHLLRLKKLCRQNLLEPH